MVPGSHRLDRVLCRCDRNEASSQADETDDRRGAFDGGCDGRTREGVQHDGLQARCPLPQPHRPEDRLRECEPEGRARLRHLVGSLPRLKVLNIVNSDLMDEEDFPDHPWSAPITDLAFGYSRLSLPVLRKLAAQISSTVKTINIFGHWCSRENDPSLKTLLDPLPHLKTLVLPSDIKFEFARMFARSPVEVIWFLDTEPTQDCDMVRKVIGEYKETLKEVKIQAAPQGFRGDVKALTKFAKEVGVMLRRGYYEIND